MLLQPVTSPVLSPVPARPVRRRLRAALRLALWLGLAGVGATSTRADIVQGLFHPLAGPGVLARPTLTLDESFPVMSLAWAPGGRFIAAAALRGAVVHVWDLAARRVVGEIDVEGGLLHAHGLAWSPDGRFLALCTQGELRVYDAPGWRLRHAWRGEGPATCAGGLAFSSDGAQLALLGRRIEVLDTRDWHVLRSTGAQPAWAQDKLLETLAFVPGSHDLLIAGAQAVGGAGAGVVWRWPEGRALPGAPLVAYPARPDSGLVATVLTLQTDGRLLATGTQTGAGAAPDTITSSVHLLDLASGALLAAPLDGQDFGPQDGLALSADGRYLVVGHGDEAAPTVHLIDLRTLQVVDTARVGAPIYDLAADPGRNRFAVGAGEHILVWELPAS